MIITKWNSTREAWSVALSGEYWWKLLTEVDQCMHEQAFGNFFLLVDLDLYPMTFIYEVTNLTRCANMNFLLQGFQKLSSDVQTDRQDWNYIRRRFASQKDSCGDIYNTQMHNRFNGDFVDDVGTVYKEVFQHVWSKCGCSVCVLFLTIELNQVWCQVTDEAILGSSSQ